MRIVSDDHTTGHATPPPSNFIQNGDTMKNTTKLNIHEALKNTTLPDISENMMHSLNMIKKPLLHWI